MPYLAPYYFTNVWAIEPFLLSEPLEQGPVYTLVVLPGLNSLVDRTLSKCLKLIKTYLAWFPGNLSTLLDVLLVIVENNVFGEGKWTHELRSLVRKILKNYVKRGNMSIFYKGMTVKSYTVFNRYW